jgi:hypothetical protein
VESSTDGTWVAASAPQSSADAPAVCGALGGEDGGLELFSEVLLVLTIFKGPTVVDFPELSPTATQLDMADAQRLVISYTANINGQVMSFKDLIYLVHRGGRFYAVDCSTLSQKYTARQEKFEEIAQTFRTD